MNAAMYAPGSWRTRLQSALEQFARLEGRHPGLWPPLPRLLCVAGAALAVTAAGAWLVWSGQWRQLDDGALLERRQREDFLAKAAQAQSLQQLRRQKAEVEQRVRTLERQLPGKAEMDALLADINRAGLERGLQFELFKPGQERLDAYYAELPIEIRLVGGFHAVAGFASDLAAMPRIVNLDRMAISAQRDGLLAFEATVRTYRYLDHDEQATQRKQAQEKGRKK